MDKAKLVLRQERGAWVCDFAQTPEAQKMVDLFGSVCVPTPFMASRPEAEVLRIVAKLNPQYAVEVA